MKRFAPVLLITALFGLACGGMSADVQGTSLTLDGAPWPVDLCTSGEAVGFDGIELTGTDGSRLRFETNPSGTADVYYLAPGASSGPHLGACATAAFNRTGLTVNDIVALEGGGTVACEGGEHSLSGTVAVARCAVPLF